MRTALPFAALLFAPSALASQEMNGNLYYFGDLHSHTGYSGDAGSTDVGHCRTTTGCGAFGDVFDDARANGMDFLALSDHVNGFRAMTAAQWLTFHATVLAADDPAGGFVTIPAGEIWAYNGSTTTSAIGHKTLLMWEDNSTLAPLTIDEVRPNTNGHLNNCQQIWDWADDLSSGYGLVSLIPHHPATLDPLWTDWSCWEGEYGPAVEVYSRHGNSLEGDSGWDIPGAGVVSDGYAASALDPDNYGLQFGFVGGTDAHDTRPGETCELDVMQPTHLYGGGLTGVVLDASEAFDRMAIYDAILDRRTYATSGPMVPLEVTWSTGTSTLGGLGSTLSVTNDEDVSISVTLLDTDAPFVDEVLAIGPHADWTLTFDGIDTWTGTVPAADVPEWLYVRVEIDGAAYYGTTTCDDGGSDSTEFVWSSPSFVELIDEDLDDDGVDSDDGDCDDDDDASYPGAVEVWYDGVDQDCDGASDFDQDGDGHEADTEGGDDCDDTDDAVSPDVQEIWYDGFDQNCDLWSDDDSDFDGHEALAAGGDDCDDTDDDVQPDAIEAWYDGVDQDCDAWSDFDQDYDGHDASVSGGDDCDDLDDGVYPGAADIDWDGLDADCDGADGVPVVADTGAVEPSAPDASDTGVAAEPYADSASADSAEPAATTEAEASRSVEVEAPAVELRDTSDTAEPAAAADTGEAVEAVEAASEEARTTETSTAPTTTVGIGIGPSRARGLNLWSRPRIRR